MDWIEVILAAAPFSSRQTVRWVSGGGYLHGRAMSRFPALDAPFKSTTGLRNIPLPEGGQRSHNHRTPCRTDNQAQLPVARDRPISRELGLAPYRRRKQPLIESRKDCNMRHHLVLAHPNKTSLCHAIANEIVAALTRIDQLLTNSIFMNAFFLI